MNELLTEAELERLDEFLLNRIPKNSEHVAEKNEGILNISMLDGFFTAIVSNQDPIMPSKWMPAVWGDYEPVWDRMDEAEEIISIMMRQMNGIVHFLMEEPGNFEPMFMESERDGKTFLIVDDWCEGYLMGMKLDPEYWNSVPAEIAEQLIPLYLFGDDEFAEQLDQISIERIEQFQKAIAPAVLNLNAYALKRRRKDMQVRRDAPKTGRNDPCPCGSGFKYKKCCGKSLIIH